MDACGPILIVGGYGVFGRRLARLLLRRHPNLRVIVAGRSLQAATAFCAEHGGKAMQFDRDADIQPALDALRPLVVVDAAGPFQHYGDDPRRLARAALACGAHYLDLSDDGAFTVGIVQLDADARRAQRAVISGVSSVPAVSAAAVTALAAGLVRIEQIETLILPGNRAPRGMSVMRAILAQVGRPLRLWRGGTWTTAAAWGGLRRDVLQLPGGERLSPRWTSVIGSPDLLLFPHHFKARSVTFRAGLELAVMHLGLWCLAWLPQLRLVQSVEWAVRPLRWIADRLLPFGSDRGGMRVLVSGRDAQGVALSRTWTLIAESGEGPFIPALPALCLVERVLAGTLLPGARPCLADLSLAEFEAVSSTFAIRCARAEHALPTLYERVLGADWHRLPAEMRDAHDVFDQRSFHGEARITRGNHPLARLLARVMGFPPASKRTPVGVTMQRRGTAERWTRTFGSHRFHSTLSAGAGEPPGCVRERFGALTFLLAVPVNESGLQMPMLRAKVMGLPLPRWLTPRSDTREYVDEHGRFCFDVDILLPLIGRVVRYEGWLIPDGATLPTGATLG